jgi:hypothetical protein
MNASLLAHATAGNSSVQTHNPTVAWIRQFGTPSNDAAFAISIFGSGIYVAGHTSEPLPGQTALGGTDAFLRRYDNSGNVVWTRQFGTAGDDFAEAVYADSSGVYIAGMENGTFPFYLFRGFVSKYDLDGFLLWTQQFGSNSGFGSTDVAGIVADGIGVYVVGRTTAGLVGQPKIAQDGDAYIIKYGHNGTQLWASEFGSTPDNGATGVSFDSTGVYMSGFTFGTLPGQSTNDNNPNGFLRKYDGAGNEIWTRQFNIADYTFAESVTAGAQSVYITGETGSGGPYLQSYTRDGVLVWTQQGGGSGDSGNSVVVGATGVYLAGDTYGNLGDQQNFGLIDVYVQKFDFQGNTEWTVHMGTSDFDSANGVAVDGSGGIYLAGSTHGVFPGQTSLGSYDAFVIKLSEAIEQISVFTFFTDAGQNLLPTDSQRNPKVYAVFSNGIVKATNPGEVLSWANITNTGTTSLESIRLNETLPPDWTVHPAWLPSQGGIHIYFVYANGTRIDISAPAMITVSIGNPSVLGLTIPDLNATLARSLLLPGESVLVSAQLSYNLIRTPQSFSSYPRTYTAATNIAVWAQTSYSGTQAFEAVSSSFNVYGKLADSK